MKLIATLALLLFASWVAAADQAGVVITSEPIRGNVPDVEINGKRVASVGLDRPYKGLIPAGKTVVAVKGASVDFDAQPNKEYVFVLDMKPTTTGSFLMLGVVGSSAAAEYTLTLKETRDLAGSPVATTAPAVSSTPVTKPAASSPTVTGEAGKSPAASVATTTAPAAVMREAPTHPQIDFAQEAAKAARILGCTPQAQKLAGASDGRVLYDTKCADGSMLMLACDATGLCLKR